jgi:DNA-binding NtrC family response regulator
MSGGRVLVVDDDPSSSAYVSLALKQAGHSVRTAANGVEALLSMEGEVPALVISDLQMPVMGGLELLTHVKERWPDVPVVLFSVEEEIATVVEAVQRGAVNYLVKPVAPAVLQAVAAKALARLSRPTPHASSTQVPEIVGVSPAMVHVRHTVSLASRSDVNVIVGGETGTGKELVARAIHRLSNLASGPFVAHNCALTPPEMFDSEFFGHRRGAFTGADRDRAGILREAHGGVLFLDELECLSLPNQAKLLRVLDDGEVRPLGSEQSRPVSVRFVAATNREPEAMIANKELREDLYYRLRGFQIELPPLRDRREDIPVLADHFLGGRRSTLTAGAREALDRSDWPGNVRQLRNVLRSACAVAGSQPIDSHHLDLAARSPSRTPPPLIGGRGDATTGMTLESVERQAIAQALETHGGNLSRAAESLGIHRSTLRRRISELGLQRKRR